MGKLTNLKHLRLSHNTFIGTITTEIQNLHLLELVHLHGNWLEGNVPALELKLKKNDSSLFITDCGLPTDLDATLACTDCTMCCEYLQPSASVILLTIYFFSSYHFDGWSLDLGNSNGDCHSKEPNSLEKVELKGFESYLHFTWVFGLVLFGYVCFVCLASTLYDKHKNEKAPLRASTV